LKQYEFINVLRPVAAFWVLIAHCLIWGGYQGYVLDPKLAVDLFMMISGFLMTAIAVERRMLDGDLLRSGLVFFGKRYFRIAPAYYVSLFAAFLLGARFLDGYSFLRQLSPEKWTWPGNEIFDPQRMSYTVGNLLSHLTFAFGLSPQGSFSSFLPDWSLGLEMQFYAIFPILFLLRRRIGIHAVAVLGAASVVVTGSLFRRAGINFYESSFLTLKLNFFLVGMVIYHFREQKGLLGRLLGVAAIVLLAWCERRGATTFAMTTGLAALMLLLHEAEMRSVGIPTLLRLPGLRRIVGLLSEWSYGVYLFHGFFISLAGHYLVAHPTTRNARSLWMIPFVVVGSLAVSAVVHRFVEVPGIAVGNRILGRIWRLTGKG